MNRQELNHVPQWRYCKIPHAQKGPRYANWQSQPFLLDQIDPELNIGVLLGEPSGGIVAVDFDGPTAWDYWREHISDRIPETIIWSSGRDSRCQMAFQVPQSVWSWLTTKKIATGEGEGLEFRWTGTQSVLPPSVHPDTERPYYWILSPQERKVAAMPIPALLYWHSYHHQSTHSSHSEPADNGSIDTVTEQEFETLSNALALIKSAHAELDYDLWMRVTFAVARTIGNRAAEELMKTYWHEKSPGEYERMLRSRNPQRSPGIGSLIHMARTVDATFMKRKEISQFNRRKYL